MEAKPVTKMTRGRKAPKRRRAKPRPVRTGSPPFEPTATNRNDVMTLKAAGLAEAAIAIALGIAHNTLRKHFGHELKNGRAAAKAKNILRLEKMAEGNVAAAKALQAIYAKAEVDELLDDPDFKAEQVARQDDKIKARRSKKAIQLEEAIAAGEDSDWGSDLAPPPGAAAH